MRQNTPLAFISTGIRLNISICTGMNIKNLLKLSQKTKRSEASETENERLEERQRQQAAGKEAKNGDFFLLCSVFYLNRHNNSGISFQRSSPTRQFKWDSFVMGCCNK